MATVHRADQCYGNCSLHPLVDKTIARMMHSSALWGDILYVPMTAEKEAEIVEYARDLDKLCESHKMKAYALLVDRMKKGKTLKPCKWLYLNEDGKTYSKHLTGAQCWAWEYIDPKTGKVEKPHSCKHLHPGDHDWCDAWNSNRDAEQQGRRWL
jgi:hypothetical protein